MGYAFEDLDKDGYLETEVVSLSHDEHDWLT